MSCHFLPRQHRQMDPTGTSGGGGGERWRRRRRKKNIWLPHPDPTSFFFFFKILTTCCTSICFKRKASRSWLVLGGWVGVHQAATHTHTHTPSSGRGDLFLHRVHPENFSSYVTLQLSDAEAVSPSALMSGKQLGLEKRPRVCKWASW